MSSSPAKMAKSALLVLLVFVLVAGVKAVSHLKLYDEPNFKHFMYEMDLHTEECYNLIDYNDYTSSVATNGTCVYLYEDYDCYGRRIKVQGRIKSLWLLNFDKVLSSVRACCPEIPGKTDCCTACKDCMGNRSFPFFLQTAKLHIYENPNHQDLIYKGVPTEECTNLEEINDRALSVETFGTCVLLYEDYDCRGRVIPVYPGSPYDKNFGEFNFDNKLSSVRACCEQSNWDDFHPPVIERPVDLTSVYRPANFTKVKVLI